jgi:integrase
MRARQRLTAIQVAKLAKRGERGRHADGENLYFRVTATATANWERRYDRDGKQHYMGLGPYPLVGLKDARVRNQDAGRLLLDGIDPIEHRRAQRADARLKAARTMLFKACAAAYIKAHAPSWKNPKHLAQWTSTLRRYAEPTLGALPVAAIDTALVLRAIEPIWTEIPETADRVRSRIEAVLDWAKVRGYRNGENPARWKGHLDHLLPARAKFCGTKHHTALPYGDVPKFLADLRGHEGVAAAALEFSVLTAARTAEVLGAAWPEIDLADRVWTVPAGRMKGGKEHRVPLSDRAVEILREARTAGGKYVFPGQAGADQPLSPSTLLPLARRVSGRLGLTVHGFRSSFRDWSAERANCPSEVAELALAHSVGSKIERAYRRSDMFDRRRLLMQAWAEYCTGPSEPARIVAIGA